MQKPRRNRGCADQHTCISGEQSSKDGRAKNEDSGSDAQELIERAGEDLMDVKLERNQTWNGAGPKRTQNPGAHRHRRSMFKDAEHVKEEMRTAPRSMISRIGETTAPAMAAIHIA